MARIKNSPKAPGSGRKKGSIDLAERKLLSDRMASDLMTAYLAAGGVDYLIKIAKEDPKTFLAQGLSRLFPAALRDDNPELLLQQFNQYNIDGLTDFELARRVAFALAKGLNLQKEVSPQEACRLERTEPRWIDPATLPPTEPTLTHEEVAAMAREKAAQDLIGYHMNGSAREHGLAKPAPVVEKSGRVPVRLRGKGRELL